MVRRSLWGSGGEGCGRSAVSAGGRLTRWFGINGLDGRLGGIHDLIYGYFRVFGNGTRVVSRFHGSEHDESAEGALIGEIETGLIAV